MSVTPTPVCRAPYVRPDGQRMSCTYPRGHENFNALPNEHSWDVIHCADITAAAEAKVDYTPQAVQAFLDSMARGEMDNYIEAILAVGHNRKRAKRGTAGFRDGATT